MEINEADDFEFDFSIYEEKDKEEEATEKSIFSKRERINNIKSRFNNSGSLFVNLGILERDLIRTGTKISRYSQDLNELWEFYAIVNEYWEYIKGLYSQITIDEIIKIKAICLNLLKECKNKNVIDDKVHNNLLFFRSKVLDLAQLKNFRFECERYGARSYDSRIRS
jgi:hypothetical protein